MFLAIDVHYRNEMARVVSLEFEHWRSTEPLTFHELEMDVAAEYQPGEFYKRELPCILEILKYSDLEKVEAIIIDGYVVLDDKGKAGLGAILYNKINKKVPIIGIAKRPFHQNRKNVALVFRGKSKNPLYITSIPFNPENYADKVKNMAGLYRIPDLIKLLDQKTKD